MLPFTKKQYTKEQDLFQQSMLKSKEPKQKNRHCFLFLLSFWYNFNEGFARITWHSRHVVFVCRVATGRSASATLFKKTPEGRRLLSSRRDWLCGGSSWLKQVTCMCRHCEHPSYTSTPRGFVGHAQCRGWATSATKQPQGWTTTAGRSFKLNLN